MHAKVILRFQIDVIPCRDPKFACLFFRDRSLREWAQLRDAIVIYACSGTGDDVRLHFDEEGNPLAIARGRSSFASSGLRGRSFLTMTIISVVRSSR